MMRANKLKTCLHTHAGKAYAERTEGDDAGKAYAEQWLCDVRTDAERLYYSTRFCLNNQSGKAVPRSAGDVRMS